jgi:hypothetical protein
MLFAPRSVTTLRFLERCQEIAVTTRQLPVVNRTAGPQRWNSMPYGLCPVANHRGFARRHGMKLCCWLTAVLLTVASVTPAAAQVQSGTIAGTVTDAQGGVLPGVTESLTSTDRSATFVTDGAQY